MRPGLVGIALAVLVGWGSFPHPTTPQEPAWVDVQLPTLTEGL